jgi:hypothetical protein
MGHPPGVLVLTDPPTSPYPFAARPSTAAWKSSTPKQTLRRPSSLAIAVGDPGSWSGLTKLASSTRVPPLGGRSMTISVRDSGMPMTVSMNSPSTNVRALDLEIQVGEERRHRVEVGDGDSDVVELPDVLHDFHPRVLVWSLVQGRSCRSILDMPAPAALESSDVTSHPSGGESRRKDAQRPQRGSCCSPVRGMKGRPLGAIFRAAAFGARCHDDHDDERDGNHRET